MMRCMIINPDNSTKNTGDNATLLCKCAESEKPVKKPLTFTGTSFILWHNTSLTRGSITERGKPE